MKGCQRSERQQPTTDDAVRSSRHMDEPTVDTSAALAKRLQHNHTVSIIPRRTPAELGAHIAAAIAAARVPWARGPVRDGPGLLDDDEELVEHVTVPAPVPADGLKTPSQAARRLGVSIRTLRGLVTSGDLRYVNVGRGKQREKIMFTDNDLNDLIAGRTRQKAQQCQSISPRARRSTTSTSSGAVLDFTARRNGQTGGKRKR
jgi:excisionase family DNA binding protein